MGMEKGKENKKISRLKKKCEVLLTDSFFWIVHIFVILVDG